MRVVSLFLLIRMDTTLMIHVLFIDVSRITVGAFRIMFTHELYCHYRKTYTAHSPPNVAVQRAAILFYVLVHGCLHVHFITGHPNFQICNFLQTVQEYRVIHKSLLNFRTRLRNNKKRQGRKENINR